MKKIIPEKIKTLKGTKLRSYAYAVLTRREYSKAEFTKKLLEYAVDENEVFELVEEFIESNYQSDARVADIVLRSQIRQGKGPQRIKQVLQKKEIDEYHILEDIKETNWLEEVYNLKVKKFGIQVEKDPKLKAKQIRFLQYRGFDLDLILKVVNNEEIDFY